MAYFTSGDLRVNTRGHSIKHFCYKTVLILSNAGPPRYERVDSPRGIDRGAGRHRERLQLAGQAQA